MAKDIWEQIGDILYDAESKELIALLEDARNREDWKLAHELLFNLVLRIIELKDKIIENQDKIIENQDKLIEGIEKTLKEANHNERTHSSKR